MRIGVLRSLVPFAQHTQAAAIAICALGCIIPPRSAVRNTEGAAPLSAAVPLQGPLIREHCTLVRNLKLSQMTAGGFPHVRMTSVDRRGVGMMLSECDDWAGKAVALRAPGGRVWNAAFEGASFTSDSLRVPVQEMT
eukprot:IDg8903t1